ncbi:MAG: hypothetical protein NZ553_11660 [Caldilinea sp.]|nr:hypothetical protein [Caldilinea sp.]MDW8441122.1 hypothetical protein [Caldilineaceae bacterium]
MEREALIARKQEVRRLLEQAQRELARLEMQPANWRTRRTRGKLENKIERLMAEEYALRLAIDRASMQ